MTLRSACEMFETAIDPVVMSPYVIATLSDMEAASAHSLRATRVFPMKGDELCIQYAVDYTDSSGAPRTALRGACLSLSGEIPPRYQGRDGLVVTVPSMGVAVPAFPFDPALPQLESVYRDQTLLPRLSEWRSYIGDDSTKVTRSLAAYRLERRCVLRLDVRANGDSMPGVYVKVAKPKKLRQSRDALAALRDRGFGADERIILPEFVHRNGDGFAFMDEVPGSAVHDLIGTGELTAALESTAHVLVTLHQTDAIDGVDPNTAEVELEKLRGWRLLLSRLYPGLAAAFDDRFRELSSRPPVAPAGFVPIHADFHDKQVIWESGRAALIDCDGLTNGDPAQDYGNFMAHMELRRMQHEEHADDIAEAMQRFRRAYPPPPVARWWAACTFLRLAALYAMRPRWRHLTPDLIDRASLDSARKVVEA